jgi:flagellar motility protein MotE (MotC chaperone)
MAVMHLTPREAQIMDIPEGSLSGTLQVIGGWAVGFATAVAVIVIPAYRRFNAARLEQRKGMVELRQEESDALASDRINVVAYFERLLEERRKERDRERAESDRRISNLEAQVKELMAENVECREGQARLTENVRHLNARLNDQTPHPTSRLGG